MSRSPDSYIKIGSVIRQTLALYVGQASVLLSVAVISLVLPAVVVAVALMVLVGSVHWSGAPVLVAVGGAGILFFAIALFASVVIELVCDVHDGKSELSVRTRLRSVSPAVLGRLILVGIVAGSIVVVLFAVLPVILLLLLIGAVIGGEVNLIGVILGFMTGMMVLVIPGLFLLTIWSVAAPVVVLERPRRLHALGRSRELVRGNGWRVFAVLAVVAVSLNIASRGIEGVAYALDRGPGLAASVIIAILALPIPPLLAAVLYLDLHQATTSDQPADATPPQAPTPPLDMPLPGTTASDTA